MNKITRKIGITVMSLVVMVAAGANPILASQPPATPRVDIADMPAILAIVNRVVGWAFVFFFAIAAFYILWAAFDYLTSGGDSKKVDAVKMKLAYAFISIILALVARGLPLLIQNFLIT